MKPASFSAARLLALYEKVAEAPGAVPRLRRFVLDLAVRGKLVEQDAGDEPASELLKRIAAEKARLVKAGAIRKPRDLDGGEELEAPFELPASWRWCRLDSVGAVIGGGTPSAGDPDNFAKAGDGVPWLTPADLGGYRDLYIERGSRDLTERGLASSSATMMPAGTVLFTSRAPIGYVAIAANPISTNQGFKSIVPYVADCSRFIALAMQTFAPEIDANAPGTTFKEVSGKIVAAVPFPLPPLAEQRRIVARVEELMALLDRLEAARDQREATRDRLTAASLARLTAPDTEASSGKVGTGFPSDDATNKNPPEAEPRKVGTGFPSGSATNRDSFPANARFALDTLPAVTTRPGQIKALRQTILNLAVRGRLVDQDPADEPVSELLKRIGRLKSERVRSGTIPRKADPVCDPAWEITILPDGWVRIALGQVTDLVTSGSRGWGEFYSDYGAGFVRAQNIRFGKLRLDDLACVKPPSNSEGSRTQVVPNDLLIVITGAGVTNPALLDRDLGEAYVSQHVGLVRPTDHALSPWLLQCLLAEAGGRAELVERAYGSGKPGLNLDNIRNLTIPLPPLAEQHRIVAKVDALMALCDRLEATLTTADTARARLLEALLQEALDPVSNTITEAAE